MKFPALICFLASSLAGFSQSSIAVTNLTEQRKLGQEFVRDLLAQRPAENTDVRGMIEIRDAKKQVTELPVQFQTLVTPTNCQTTFLAKLPGESVLHPRLRVIHEPDQASQYFLPDDEQTKTNGLVVALRILRENETMIPFVNSDFWIADLGLEFLHWPEQRMTRREMRRSQFCKVIESINPQPTTNAYSKVISWIDHDSGGIVYAEAYDANHKLLKEFVPKAVKKVKGEWELREMEIRNVQTGSRTRIEFNLEEK